MKIKIYFRINKIHKNYNTKTDIDKKTITNEYKIQRKNYITISS